MRRIPFFIIVLTLFVVSAAARADDRKPSDPVRMTRSHRTTAVLPAAGWIPNTAHYETTFLAVYTWDQSGMCLTEGWLSEDRTAQTHHFWHVADGAELDGGSFGGLLPLEGAQSMWCGADGPVAGATDRVLCLYAALPGYGNNWGQSLVLKDCLTEAGGVVVDASVRWDSEPNYDATTLEVDNCDDNWVAVYGGLGTWDGTGADTVSIAVPDSLHAGLLRIRFRFESDGAWSDQDGLWDTDGAFVLDQLMVSDTSGVRVPYEDFEDESPGTRETQDWVSATKPGFGDFAALYPGYTLVQEDPCESRLGCMWAFINGSTDDYSWGGWPTQIVVPWENENHESISNFVYSPDIAIAGAGSLWELGFDVYRDVPFDNLVFYTWGVRSIGPDGCPPAWNGDGFVYYGGGKDWYRETVTIGQYIAPGATHIQVSLGVVDMFPIWGCIYGHPAGHSHAPLFDYAEVYRINVNGPVWTLRDIDMFQDNFSDDGSITGTARADMAQDILPGSSAGIRPGDSTCVDVSDPGGGMGFHTPGDPSSGAAVYLYCSVDGPNAGATGGDLVVDARYHYVGTVSAGGRTWFQIQMDSTWASGGTLVENRYNIDLNDNLFVPGDEVWFFFGARNASGEWTYSSLFLPKPSFGTTDIEEAAEAADEFAILPAAPDNRILYVDGMNLRGAQPFFDQAFWTSIHYDEVDRYDIRGPSSAVGNHPGARVKSASQLYSVYYQIYWNTGDLGTAFSSGVGWPDKSDDTGLLLSFLENLPGPGGGVYLSGDDVASVWLFDLAGASETQLRNKYCPFGVAGGAAGGNHAPTVGVSPMAVGEPGGIFDHWFGPDSLVTYGGCPQVNDFDMLTAEGTANLEMSYHGNGTTAGAIVSDTTTNAVGNTVGFVLSGFSFHEIRDHRPMGVPVRHNHLQQIYLWLGGEWSSIGATGAVVSRNQLDQNYPNPFNPVTTIRYQVKSTGPVTLRIYNVAGQLVRTLVDDVVEAGMIHEATWRGRNDAGSPVASGVYFYKLVAGDFVQTKKMVLLK
jgi:hypothetical protein